MTGLECRPLDKGHSVSSIELPVSRNQRKLHKNDQNVTAKYNYELEIHNKCVLGRCIGPHFVGEAHSAPRCPRWINEAAQGVESNTLLKQESPANAKGTRDSSACMKAHCEQM